MAKGRIIALGYFDGVHMGHGGLLRKTKELAQERGLSAAAVTFYPHPSKLLTGKSVPLLSTVGDRARIMQSLYQMDEVLPLPFDMAMMQMPWEDFLTEILLKEFGAEGLVCGHDFRFGFQGEGTPEKLKDFCEKQGIPCAVIAEIQIEGAPASSTRIRRLICEGEMAKAVEVLGHPHLLTGKVVGGKHRGHTWGIPTANVPFPEDIAVPAFGVYATKATVEGKGYMAVTNVGVHPTVGEMSAPVAEAWILDFDEDLYGKEISLEFYYRIREERKFPGVEEMAAEIRQNAEEVRAFFNKRAK